MAKWTAFKYRDYTSSDYNGTALASEGIWVKYGYGVIAIPKDLVPFMKENLTVATSKAILAIKEALLLAKN